MINRSIISFILISFAFCVALTATLTATITLDMIAIGNVDNAADTINPSPAANYGSVSYAYEIGKTEVTTAQYVAFLNATASTVDTYGLYNAEMANMGGPGVGISQTGGGGVNFSYTVTGGGENRPVAYISWFDAARFSNWMTTGQGTTTETGSYMLNGATTGDTVARNQSIGGYYIPTEDEWYKAAYYNAATASYSLFANGTNAITTADANYANPTGSTTDVGTYSLDPSPYGTYDQGGNVKEVVNLNAGAADSVILRGGSFVSGTSYSLRSLNRVSSPIDLEGPSTGFRVSVVPDPSSALLVMLSVVAVNGNVTGGGNYLPGSSATLSATAAAGYVFSSWSGAATGASNPLSLVVNSATSVTANFSPSTVDTDGDGLNDYLEAVVYGTNPVLADSDGDGFDDPFEINAGFNPSLASSTPDAVASIRTAMEFRFNTANGVSYRIEASTDLTNWASVEGTIIGTGDVVTRFYSTENQPKRYFRVLRN
jgi:formylglycine-generating enzyme required for sulfatase activity